jgi:hypothetical protein
MRCPSLFILGFLALLGCSSAKRVSFKSPVDTTSKRIFIQTKQTYKLTDLGVYASNDFDGARLNSLKSVNDSTALVSIYPENAPINNSPYYAFKTWSDEARTFYFTFYYPKGFKHRYIPKIQTDGVWRVLDSSRVFKTDSIVTIKLDLNSSPQTVAAQEIRSSRDVQTWYTNLVKGKEDYVTVKSLGETRLGRNLPMLDINKGNAKEKDLIVLVTRQHPPEVTGFYAFQSFLETILNGTELSEKFLSRYHVLAFPIMNPDGVDLGHWRHNAGGVDMNRDWSVYNQPEIKQVVKTINKNIRKNKTRLVLGLDFHSTWYDVFYTNTQREGTSLPHFESHWFEALESHIPNYEVNEQSANSDRPTSKGWLLYGHNAVGITYEIGDATPKDKIELFGSVSAEQMMNILLNKY